MLRSNKKSPLERGGTIVPGCVASENLFKHPQKNNKKGVKSKSFSVATHPAAKAAPLSRGEFVGRNPFRVIPNNKKIAIIMSKMSEKNYEKLS